MGWQADESVGLGALQRRLESSATGAYTARHVPRPPRARLHVHVVLHRRQRAFSPGAEPACCAHIRDVRAGQWPLSRAGRWPLLPDTTPREPAKGPSQEPADGPSYQAAITPQAACPGHVPYPAPNVFDCEPCPLEVAHGHWSTDHHVFRSRTRGLPTNGNETGRFVAEKTATARAAAARVDRRGGSFTPPRRF